MIRNEYNDNSSIDDSYYIDSRSTSDVDETQCSYNYVCNEPKISCGSNIGDISMYDVLCGRTKVALSHVGNRRFRVLISVYLERYLNSTKDEKSHIINIIIESIQNCGGRFLQKNDDNIYTELDIKGTRQKVGHALRDMALTNSSPKTRAKARSTDSPSFSLSSSESQPKQLLEKQIRDFPDHLMNNGKEVLQPSGQSDLPKQEADSITVLKSSTNTYESSYDSQSGVSDTKTYHQSMHAKSNYQMNNSCLNEDQEIIPIEFDLPRWYPVSFDEETISMLLSMKP